jgi:peptidyl-prolyl cis-trans isomerase D
MFDFVHKQKKIIMGIIMLIALTFAVWGIESYTRGRRQTDAVAKIGHLVISRREFTEELGRQQERLRQVFGRNFDPSTVDTLETRHALLEGMIQQRLVARAAVKSRLLVSDAALRDVIAGIPAFQRDGKFSKSVYEAMLRAQNPPLTPAAYESSLRYELALGQLSRAISQTAISPQAVVQRLVHLEEEQREVSEALVPADKFLGQVKVDDAQVKAYYDSHQDEFRTPERVRAQYLELSAADLARQAAVSDADVKKLYESHASQYRVPEERRVSHILIAVPADAKPAEREAARKKAEQILAELRKSPQRFAALAKKYSQDPGSAQNGGDLGLFGRGMMVKPVEDAAFALKEGETSGIVESEYGYHIIKLNGIQPARARTLDEVRPELVAEIQKQKGTQRFAEAAESFTNMVYEQSDSLEPAAERYKLPLHTTGWISKDKAPGVLNNKRLLNALFSDDAIRNKRNTDAIEVGSDKLVAARVLEHQAASLQKYEAVKAQIEKELRRREAAALAAKDGAALLEKLRQGEGAGLKWGKEHRVSRRAAEGLSEATLRLIVSANVSKLPAYVGAAAGDQGYAIYRISKVIEPAGKTDQQKAADLQRIARVDGQAEYQAYVDNLRSSTDVEIDEKLLRPQQQQ